MHASSILSSLKLPQEQTLSVPRTFGLLSSEADTATALQVFSTSHKLSDINDSYWDFRVEAVPDEELNASAASRSIHVYHIAPQSTAVRSRLGPHLPVSPLRYHSASRLHRPHTALSLLSPQRLKAQGVLLGTARLLDTTHATCSTLVPHPY